MTRHHRDFIGVTGKKIAGFRKDMASEMRRLADALDKGEDFAVIGIMSCNYDSEGGPMVLVDRDVATVELIDEMSMTMKDALFEGLE